MFCKNTYHLQIPLAGHMDELSEPLRKRLENSCMETFCRECFCRLDEQPFAVPDVDTPSWPNEPVKFLVSVDLRTHDSCRERLARHGQETGENLREQAFAQVTDQQRRVFSLKSGKQRMDSILLAAVLPELKALIRVETIIADRGYGSSEKDALLAEHRITLLQMPKQGRLQDLERLHLDDCQVQTDASGSLKQVTCPEGELAGITSSPSGRKFMAVFRGTYARCVRSARCSSVWQKQSEKWFLPLTMEGMQGVNRRISVVFCDSSRSSVAV